jgi:hypothetical protein
VAYNEAGEADGWSRGLGLQPMRPKTQRERGLRGLDRGRRPIVDGLGRGQRKIEASRVQGRWRIMAVAYDEAGDADGWSRGQGWRPIATKDTPRAWAVWPRSILTADPGRPRTRQIEAGMRQGRRRGRWTIVAAACDEADSGLRRGRWGITWPTRPAANHGRGETNG